MDSDYWILFALYFNNCRKFLNVSEYLRMFFVNLDDQLSEKGIGPGKPIPGIIGWIVFIEGFMHKSFSGMGVFQGYNTFPDFIGLGAGKGLHGKGDWPYFIDKGMRTANSFGCFAAEIPWVILAEQESSCI